MPSLFTRFIYFDLFPVLIFCLLSGSHHIVVGNVDIKTSHLENKDYLAIENWGALPLFYLPPRETILRNFPMSEHDCFHFYKELQKVDIRNLFY